MQFCSDHSVKRNILGLLRLYGFAIFSDIEYLSRLEDEGVGVEPLLL